jgi:hypothetical protein
MKYHRKLEKLGDIFRAFYECSYYKNEYKISKDEYFNYVRRRLKRSFYPRQINDFFFLKMPDKFKRYKNYTTKEIPVDWLIANIVQYFWDNGVMTQNIDQGGRDYSNQKPDHEVPVFIRVLYNKKALDIVGKMKVDYIIEQNKFIFITFSQSELPRIYKILDLETPDINLAFTGRLLSQKFSKKKSFRYENIEDEFSELVEYPDFFKWNGSSYRC